MNVEYRKSFLKDIRKIKDRNIQKRLKAVLLESVTSIDSMQGVVLLSGTSEYYRLRVGDYRLGLKVSDEKAELIRFLSRGKVYKHFP
ncbi:MAG: mRNA interferase RelE/StbE [Lentimonas sp.]|jgi:mRNA interferase RelE/StbE